jgi:hypothetical protein
MFRWIKMHRLVRAAMYRRVAHLVPHKAMLAQKDGSDHRCARDSAHRAVGVKRFGLPYQQNIDLT